MNILNINKAKSIMSLLVVHKVGKKTFFEIEKKLAFFTFFSISEQKLMCKGKFPVSINSSANSSDMRYFASQIDE